MSPCFSAVSSESVNEPDTEGLSVGYLFDNKASYTQFPHFQDPIPFQDLVDWERLYQNYLAKHLE